MKLEEKIKKVNQLLLKGEPGNITQDLQNGYIGYHIQYVIDAMNAVFGVEGWHFNWSDAQVYEGKKRNMMLLNVKVNFFVKMADGQWAGVESVGQAEIEHDRIGDAKKTAIADGLKKALSYASIGNRAYLGDLEKAMKEKEPDFLMVQTKELGAIAGQILKSEITQTDLKCDGCQGERLTVAEAQFSLQVYGKVLGRDCQLKVNKKNQKDGKRKKLNNRKKR